MPWQEKVVCPALVGRDPEVRALQKMVDRARSEKGQMALISGEAGVGKSRLVAEVKASVESHGFLLLQGGCLETDRTCPYGPLLDLLRGHFSGTSRSEIAGQIGPFARELYQLLPEMVQLPPDPTPLPALDPQQEKRRLFSALVSFFHHQARRQPLLLIVEDVHWSDDTSLEFLHTLARRSQEKPLMIVATLRSEERHPALERWLARLDRSRLSRQFHLSPLSRDDVAVMLQTIVDLEHSPHPTFLEALYALSDGNPLFVEEILSTLVQTGEFSRFYGQGGPESLEEIRIPRSVGDALRQRMDRLTSDARALLRVAAVAGRRFDFSVVADVTQLEESHLLDLLQELIEAQLVVEESAERFAFRHALTREAIYARMLIRERRATHRAIAERLEGAQKEQAGRQVADLAGHYYKGQRWAQALKYGRQAGERALALYTPGAAVVHFNRALEAAERLGIEPGPALHRQRAAAYETLGRFEDAHSDLLASLEIARTTDGRKEEWQALCDLGTLWAARDYERAQEYLQKALEAARSSGDPRTVAHSLNRLGNWYANAQRNAEARQRHEEALEIFRKAGDNAGVADTLDFLGLVHLHEGDMYGAAEYYEQAAERFRDLGDRRRLSSSLLMLTVASTPRCHIDLATFPERPQAQQEVQEALAIARAIGWRANEADALFNRAIASGYRGQYGRALPAARQSLAIAEEIGHRQWAAEGEYGLGVLALDLLCYQRARKHLERALAQAREVNSIAWMQIAAPPLSLAHLRDGEPAAAEAILDEIFGRESPMQTLQQRGHWAARAELALAGDDARTALEITNQLKSSASTVARQDDTAIPRLAYLCGRGMATLQRFPQAESALRAALDGARRQEARPLQWRIQVTLGDLYRRLDREEEAEQAFSAAGKIIRSLAETIPDEEWRDTFLRAAGERLPRKYSPIETETKKKAPGGLTPRQAEIAWHVAQGKSNKAIAEELVLSVRTVEDHVSNVLAKLDFRSRTEIAAWAIEQGLQSGE